MVVLVNYILEIPLVVVGVYLIFGIANALDSTKIPS